MKSFNIRQTFCFIFQCVKVRHWYLSGNIKQQYDTLWQMMFVYIPSSGRRLRLDDAHQKVRTDNQRNELCELFLQWRKSEWWKYNCTMTTVFFLAWNTCAVIIPAEWRRDLFMPVGPWCPADSQDPHRCSGEEQHSTQTHPRDEELGRLNDHSESHCRRNINRCGRRCLAVWKGFCPYFMCGTWSVLLFFLSLLNKWDVLFS